MTLIKRHAKVLSVGAAILFAGCSPDDSHLASKKQPTISEFEAWLRSSLPAPSPTPNPDPFATPGPTPAPTPLPTPITPDCHGTFSITGIPGVQTLNIVASSGALSGTASGSSGSFQLSGRCELRNGVNAISIEISGIGYVLDGTYGRDLFTGSFSARGGYRNSYGYFGSWIAGR